MAKISDLIKTLEEKSEIYNKEHLPEGWMKSIDSRNNKVILVNPEQTQYLDFNSIYIAGFQHSTQQFVWGFESYHLKEEMRNKTLKINDIGHKNRVLEFIEGVLFVDPEIVQLQKVNRSSNNEENCTQDENGFYSKYTISELLALASKALNPEALITLEFPEADFTAFYFVYGKPESLNVPT